MNAKSFYVHKSLCKQILGKDNRTPGKKMIMIIKKGLTETVHVKKNTSIHYCYQNKRKTDNTCQ